MSASQTKRGSAAETVANLVVGLAVSFACNAVVLPLCHIAETAEQNVELTLIFTVISIVRSYCMRRLFNWLSVKGVFG